MLIIRRTFEATELGFRVESHLALGPRHRIVASRLPDRCVFDVALLPAEPMAPRAYLVVLLEGSVWMRTRNQRVSAPALVVCRDRDTFYGREASVVVDRQAALAIQIDPDLTCVGVETQTLSLDSDEVDAANALHGALSHVGSFGSFVALHDAFLERLRARGIVTSELPRAKVPEERHVRFAEALSAALGLTGLRPDHLDLASATGLTERTSRRMFAEIAAEYGWVYPGWRPLRRQWSLVLACLMLTNPEATASAVRRLVGFSSTTSLFHALRRAGLPPPGELTMRAARIRAELDALRARPT